MTKPVIERREWHITYDTPHGPISKKYAQDKVFINGKLAGYIPLDGPGAEKFHPLGGLDHVWEKVVSDELGLAGSLKAPEVHEPMEPIEIDEAIDE